MKNTIILLAALFALTACNTFEGLGQDVEQAGAGISNAATKTKDKINGQ